MSKPEIVFLDTNHNIVNEDHPDAYWKVVHTYDEEDVLIDEQWIQLEKS